MTIAVVAIFIGLAAIAVIGVIAITPGHFGLDPETFTVRFEGEAIRLQLFLLCLQMVGMIVILMQLRAILKTVTQDEPFARENVRHLSIIAFVIAGLAIIEPVIILMSWAFLGNYGTTDWEFDLGEVVFALMIFVLAQVFAEGSRLREEEKMTI